MISDVKEGVRLAASDAEMECRQRSIRRSSLKAGMTIERCIRTGVWLVRFHVRCVQSPLPSTLAAVLYCALARRVAEIVYAADRAAIIGSAASIPETNVPGMKSNVFSAV